MYHQSLVRCFGIWDSVRALNISTKPKSSWETKHYDITNHIICSNKFIHVLSNVHPNWFILPCIMAIDSYRLYKGAGTLTLPSLLPARSAAFPPAAASECQKHLLPRSMALANASHGHLIKPHVPSEGHNYSTTELQRNVNFKTQAYVPLKYVPYPCSISFMLPTRNISVTSKTALDFRRLISQHQVQTLLDLA